MSDIDQDPHATLVVEYSASIEYYIEFKIKDGSDAITRVTGPDGDAWRADLYPLYTTEDVLEMWADNFVRRNCENINELDGWGDVPVGDVTISYSRSQ